MASVVVATATSSSSSSASSISLGETRANAGGRGNALEGSQAMETIEAIETAQHQNQPQHHSQQLQHHDACPATAVEVDNPSSYRSEQNALPGDLRRLLLEVAKTGACSWLSWDQDSKDLTSSEYAAAASSPGVAPHLAKASLSGPTTAMARQPFSTHRRSTSSPYAAAVSQGPPRKKHRNGLHKTTRRRFAAAADATAKSGGGRKRPLFLIRTHPNTTANANAFSAPGSVGSGRTSGSEPDDSTQYECDSEGTSATTNSEVSVERLRKSQQRVNANAVQAPNKISSAASIGEESLSSLHYKTLKEAFRVSLGLVLDHFYKHCGGYKLSPAEKRRNATLSTSSNLSENVGDDKRISQLSPEDLFQQRRQKLLTVLLPDYETQAGAARLRKLTMGNGPPFTVQRIAEVLASPKKYYTQTHKLCNCLEKLLLVTSSTGAFGGNSGGDTSQSRREERELAALADEKGRQESELRQRRLRRRASSPLDDLLDSSNDASRSFGAGTKDDAGDSRKRYLSEKKTDGFDDNSHGGSPKSRHVDMSDPPSREMLEAAARASLRTKFDHVGIDPHLSPDRDVRSIAESRVMTNSPPPPSLAMSVAPSNIAGFVRQHLPEQNADHHGIARVPSPILFSPGSESPMHATTSMHMLQLHHAVALTGVSLGHAAPSPLDLVTIDAGNGAAGRSQGTLTGVPENADLEAEHGRSSASNSDVDSESDDISLDDSASDRSDGSDSGSAPHYEPFTAARAMALNRMQQQQRLQSRVLTSLSLHQSEGFRPPADSEYQSGDSIDSMRAEDSGGSDSSSTSDLAD